LFKARVDRRVNISLKEPDNRMGKRRIGETKQEWGRWEEDENDLNRSI
jgi:hypothetical protein